MIPDKIDGLEVHKPLDAILDEKQPSLQLPPQAIATELLRDPILNALAENLQGIRNAEQLRANQTTLTIAVQQAAASQGISQVACAACRSITARTWPSGFLHVWARGLRRRRRAPPQSASLSARLRAP